MLALLTGGSGSGKSEYAENLAVRLHGEHAASRKTGDAEQPGRLIYLATMRNTGGDGETAERIRRHRKAREGKGFVTVECGRTIGAIPFSSGDTVLLEDLPNLLSNELYEEEPAEDLHEAVLQPLFQLSERGVRVVVVTGSVCSDGPSPYPETERFKKILSELNCELAMRAEFAAELCAGIPLVLKQQISPHGL